MQLLLSLHQGQELPAAEQEGHPSSPAVPDEQLGSGHTACTCRGLYTTRQDHSHTQPPASQASHSHGAGASKLRGRVGLKEAEQGISWEARAKDTKAWG